MFRMRRIATVRAVEPSLLVSIKRHDFRSFLSINAEVQAAVEAEVGRWDQSGATATTH